MAQPLYILLCALSLHYVSSVEQIVHLKGTLIPLRDILVRRIGLQNMASVKRVDVILVSKTRKQRVSTKGADWFETSSGKAGTWCWLSAMTLLLTTFDENICPSCISWL
jgi:hypothetical protein